MFDPFQHAFASLNDPDLENPAAAPNPTEDPAPTAVPPWSPASMPEHPLLNTVSMDTAPQHSTSTIVPVRNSASMSELPPRDPASKPDLAPPRGPPKAMSRWNPASMPDRHPPRRPPTTNPPQDPAPAAVPLQIPRPRTDDEALGQTHHVGDDLPRLIVFSNQMQPNGISWHVKAQWMAVIIAGPQAAIFIPVPPPGQFMLERLHNALRNFPHDQWELYFGKNHRMAYIVARDVEAPMANNIRQVRILLEWYGVTGPFHWHEIPGPSLEPGEVRPVVLTYCVVDSTSNLILNDSTIHHFVCSGLVRARQPQMLQFGPSVMLMPSIPPGAPQPQGIPPEILDPTMSLSYKELLNELGLAEEGGMGGAP